MSLQSAMTLKGAISVIADQDLRERDTTVQVSANSIILHGHSEPVNIFILLFLIRDIIAFPEL